GPFINVGNVLPETSTDFVIYNDYSVDVNTKSYYYQVIISDSCGNDAVTGNIGKTIFLTVESSTDMKNILSWNEYESWLGTVSSYSIYRKTNNVWESTPISVLPQGTTSYIDDVTNLINSDGGFVYMIEATEGQGNPYLFIDSSQSNEATVTQSPLLFIPNAFTPEGLNSIFKPYSIFVDAKEYNFSIFNRWGLEVFQTNDPNLGWDGTFKGSKSPQGIYIYSVKYKNTQKTFIEKTGAVTLLR
ncbi:MAG: gliding motility-associated C-terminal domain-containing protein, partial [Bacteroidetes bacterium]|nr:gliding motility-associated C-terminal domain-containing protein [Bacteroidota bacterium]